MCIRDSLHAVRHGGDITLGIFSIADGNVLHVDFLDLLLGKSVEERLSLIHI